MEEFEVKCPCKKEIEEHDVKMDCSHCGDKDTKIVMLISKCEKCGYLETGHILDYKNIWGNE